MSAAPSTHCIAAKDYGTSIAASRSFRVRATIASPFPPFAGNANKLPRAPVGSSAATHTSALQLACARSSESVAKSLDDAARELHFSQVQRPFADV